MKTTACPADELKSLCASVLAAAIDGTLLATDWNSGSLFAWSEKNGMRKLAAGFKGAADFCVVPKGKGMTVVVPDLVKSELRFVQLSQ